jgi:hypothetical protein
VRIVSVIWAIPIQFLGQFIWLHGRGGFGQRWRLLVVLDGYFECLFEFDVFARVYRGRILHHGSGLPVMSMSEVGSGLKGRDGELKGEEAVMGNTRRKYMQKLEKNNQCHSV